MASEYAVAKRPLGFDWFRSRSVFRAAKSLRLARRMNRAVAVAEWQGPEAGLALLEALASPAWLAGSHLWDAVLGDLHRRVGNVEIAQRHVERASGSAPTEAVRNLLRRRLATAA